MPVTSQALPAPPQRKTPTNERECAEPQVQGLWGDTRLPLISTPLHQSFHPGTTHSINFSFGVEKETFPPEQMVWPSHDTVSKILVLNSAEKHIPPYVQRGKNISLHY